MSNFEYAENNSTIGTVVVKYGIAAAALSVALMGPVPPNYGSSQVSSAKVVQVASTPSAAAVVDSVGNLDLPPSFEEQMAGFYGALQIQQEVLGVEFEKVLFENLWDLYAEA